MCSQPYIYNRLFLVAQNLNFTTSPLYLSFLFYVISKNSKFCQQFAKCLQPYIIDQYTCAPPTGTSKIKKYLHLQSYSNVFVLLSQLKKKMGSHEIWKNQNSTKSIQNTKPSQRREIYRSQTSYYPDSNSKKIGLSEIGVLSTRLRARLLGGIKVELQNSVFYFNRCAK